MNDKITKALETVNELHGETLRKMDDDTLIEAVAKAMSESGNKDWMYAEDWFKDIYIGQAIAALAVCRPIIEAETREKCARIAEGWDRSYDRTGSAIAAAIREGSDE